MLSKMLLRVGSITMFLLLLTLAINSSFLNNSDS